MPGDFDLEEALESDAKKTQDMVSRYDRDQGFQWPPLGQILAQAAFFLGVVAVLLFLMMLPFAGSDKAIPSNVWIGGGLLFIVFFFAIGMGLKALVGWVEP